jgi:hypothetical protein
MRKNNQFSHLEPNLFEERRLREQVELDEYEIFDDYIEVMATFG